MICLAISDNNHSNGINGIFSFYFTRSFEMKPYIHIHFHFQNDPISSYLHVVTLLHTCSHINIKAISILNIDNNHDIRKQEGHLTSFMQAQISNKMICDKRRLNVRSTYLQPIERGMYEADNYILHNLNLICTVHDSYKILFIICNIHL